MEMLWNGAELVKVMFVQNFLKFRCHSRRSCDRENFQVFPSKNCSPGREQQRYQSTSLDREVPCAYSRGELT